MRPNEILGAFTCVSSGSQPKGWGKMGPGWAAFIFLFVSVASYSDYDFGPPLSLGGSGGSWSGGGGSWGSPSWGAAGGSTTPEDRCCRATSPSRACNTCPSRTARTIVWRPCCCRHPVIFCNAEKRSACCNYWADPKNGGDRRFCSAPPPRICNN